MISTDSTQNTYKIGAIANLTGLSTHTIRAWERRYGMVLSDRTDGGTRLYSQESLDRLVLLKQLLDQGESISVISGLEIHELRERLDQFGLKSPGLSVISSKKQFTVAMFADPEPRQTLYSFDTGGSLSIGYCSSDFEHVHQFLEKNRDTVDACVLKYDFIGEEHIGLFKQFTEEFTDIVWVVEFSLASNSHLEALSEKGVKAIRGPLPDKQLFETIASIIKFQKGDALKETRAVAQSEPSFTPEQLNKLINLTSSNACDYASHLSVIIQNLSVFEKYCESCEQNIEDEDLHHKVKGLTAKSRSLLEDAIKQICVSSGMDIN